MSALATVDEIVALAPDKPWGWRLVVELDLAMRGPVKRKHLAEYVDPPTLESMAKGDPPAAPGSWVEHAACKSQRMWYSQHTVHTNPNLSLLDVTMEEEALATCERCPVLAKCRAWALTLPDPATDMVAGGMTPRERYLWRRDHR